MSQLEDILNAFKQGELDLEKARSEIESREILALGESTLDLDRQRRTGMGEVVYGEHKSAGQIRDIVLALLEREQNILVTRLSDEKYNEISSSFPQARYSAKARLLQHKIRPGKMRTGTIAVVSAGTSDSAVSEEAALTAEFFDNSVLRISDVGVAGIHRLMARLDEIRTARVIIVVAGMEGALPSVVAGLVDKPVIAVPTSVGYGASFGGLAALLGMLNSCSGGISVVNIDNGFGAAVMASKINAL